MDKTGRKPFKLFSKIEKKALLLFFLGGQHDETIPTSTKSPCKRPQRATVIIISCVVLGLWTTGDSFSS